MASGLENLLAAGRAAEAAGALLSAARRAAGDQRFELILLAASCAHDAGQAGQVARLLTTLSESTPPDAAAGARLLELSLAHQRDALAPLGEQRATLYELERTGVPADVVHEQRAWLHDQAGSRFEALSVLRSACEAALTPARALQRGLLALAMSKHDEAREALETMPRSEALADRARRLILALHLGLATSDHDSLGADSAALLTLAEQAQLGWLDRAATDLRLRARWLTEDIDPLQSFALELAARRTRWRDPRPPAATHAWRRLTADARLAALRWAAGHPPRDDRYHPTQPSAPAPIRLPSLTRRRAQADLAAARLLAHARRADQRFATDQRSSEAIARAARIRAICPQGVD